MIKWGDGTLMADRMIAATVRTHLYSAADGGRRHQFPVRVVDLGDDRLWVAARDLTDVLGRNVMTAVAGLDSHHGRSVRADELPADMDLPVSSGGDVWLLSEEGAYELAERHKDSRFGGPILERWLACEVAGRDESFVAELAAQRKLSRSLVAARAAAQQPAPPEPRSAEGPVSGRKSCALYRLYDTRKRLLYVGISINLSARLHGHSKRTWWHEVATIRVEHLRDRRTAMDAEERAIRKERPMYNIIHRAS